MTGQKIDLQEKLTLLSPFPNAGSETFFRVQNMENLNNENKVFDYILNKDTSEKLVFSRNWEYALFAPTTTKSDTLFTIQSLAFKRTFQYYKVMFEFNWCYYKFI